MEERKLSIEVQRKDYSPSDLKKMDSSPDDKIHFQHGETSKMLGESTLDNWYELRFPTLGPDRRGYHSSFIHNKR
jgi:hypothetical protein